MFIKTCKKCGNTKQSTDFYLNSRNLDNLSENCKNCDKRKNLIANKNGRTTRKSHLKRKYKLTINEYNQLFDKQCGFCYTCLTHQKEFKKRLAVDHCHKTGKIRGLLCSNCNLTLGKVNDSIEILKRMINYLEKNQ